jgi:hypothetical protein
MYTKIILTYFLNSMGNCDGRKATWQTNFSFSWGVLWTTPVVQYLIIPLPEISCLLRYMCYSVTRSYYSPHSPFLFLFSILRNYPIAITESVLLLPVYQHEAVLNILHILTHIYSRNVVESYLPSVLSRSLLKWYTSLYQGLIDYIKWFKLHCFLNTWHSESTALMLPFPKYYVLLVYSFNWIGRTQHIYKAKKATCFDCKQSSPGLTFIL